MMTGGSRGLVEGIRFVLDSLYPPPVPVPLNSLDNFTFLCAVILSAQTTDGKVNEVTKSLFKQAPTPQALANMDQPAVQAIIQSVGLAPQKSANLIKMSQRLVDKFGGVIPNNYEDLESLAGVGHKTASVVMSQCFGEPAIAVDTHVHRLALRWGLSKEQRNVTKVQKDLCNTFPVECWNNIHLQMIYFGREYCTAKDHKNSECPICSWVHTKTLSSINIHDFTPRKRVKGIVYYEDRVKELKALPELSSFSPTKLKDQPLAPNIPISIDEGIDRKSPAKKRKSSAPSDNSAPLTPTTRRRK